ncbi:MAG: hypothetical protein ACFBSD_09340 [Paracoccaceae bacterium]
MQKPFALTAAAAVCALFGSVWSAPADAGVVRLTDTAVGERAPELVTGLSFQNGDFTVNSIGGPSILNDAEEERVVWTFEFTGALATPALALRAATLELTWRTEGDTPGNDTLRLNRLPEVAVFGNATRFSDFTETFDLAELYSPDDILAILNGTGEFTFGTNNDSYPYRATIDLAVTTHIPVPASGALMLGLALWPVLRARRSFRTRRVAGGRAPG